VTELDDTPLPREAGPDARQSRYRALLERLRLMLADETDAVAAMATVACELHHAFDDYDWTGFYRFAGDRTLVVGPYQGTHGCLRIDFARGVCGAAARNRETQLVPDVEAFPGHIACSSHTRSEIVVPVVTPDGALHAVLDVDSNRLAAFDAHDQAGLEAIARWLGATWDTSAADETG